VCGVQVDIRVSDQDRFSIESTGDIYPHKMAEIRGLGCQTCPLGRRK